MMVMKAFKSIFMLTSFLKVRSLVPKTMFHSTFHTQYVCLSSTYSCISMPICSKGKYQMENFWKHKQIQLMHLGSKHNCMSKTRVEKYFACESSTRASTFSNKILQLGYWNMTHPCIQEIQEKRTKIHFAQESPKVPYVSQTDTMYVLWVWTHNPFQTNWTDGTLLR